MRQRAFLVSLVALLSASALAWLAGSMHEAPIWPAALAVPILAGAVAVWLGRSQVAPLEEIRTALDQLADGDARARLRSMRADEVGRLARSVDRVAERLDARAQDITQIEARSRAILDAMVEAVIVTDEDGRIVLSNAAFAAIAKADTTGRTVMEALRSPELHDAVRTANEGKKARATVQAAKGAEPRTLEATVSPLPDQSGVVVVMHDVTELRRTDAVRRDFVANASHELRTPLTSIRGFAETLDSGALSDAAVSKRFVRGIVENANRLQRLVDDLLELSRAESPEARIELRPLVVADVAARVLHALEARARERRIQLALEPGGADVVALADVRALDQVLLNLVENAIKYTPEGGHVTVRLRAEGEHVLVVVADDGVGIAPQHLPRLFERFYRVDSGRARAEGGTGLGLSIVKHLVGRMRAEISVESRLGKGTSFTVRLARAPS